MVQFCQLFVFVMSVGSQNTEGEVEPTDANQTEARAHDDAGKLAQTSEEPDSPRDKGVKRKRDEPLNGGRANYRHCKYGYVQGGTFHGGSRQLPSL